MYGNGNGPANSGARKVTAPELRARKIKPSYAQASRPTAEGTAHRISPRISMVTAYDFTMARLADMSGVDSVLVGDSLGMVVQGLQNTIPVTLDEIAYHARAVARGLTHAHLIGDLPFMSYQVSPAQAVESAGKLMKEGFVESVKLEGGEEFAEHVRRIVRAGIPVCGHVGLTPQSVHQFGGFKVQGRGDGAEKIIADAHALEDAGAFMVVLEAIPPDVAAQITAELSIPTIGIGAGVECDGQVLVCTDLLGMIPSTAPGFKAPKFAKRFAEVGEAAVAAFEQYIAEVQSGAFPGAEHTYKANGARAQKEIPPAAESGERVTDFDAPLALDLWN
jgi:3-methyl-2-oxobutanoate hydroxymethyltransferase